MKYLVVRFDWNSSGYFDTELGLVEKEDVEALARKLKSKGYKGSMKKFVQGIGTLKEGGYDEDCGEDCGIGYCVKPYESIKLEELVKREGIR